MNTGPFDWREQVYRRDQSNGGPVDWGDQFTVGSDVVSDVRLDV